MAGKDTSRKKRKKRKNGGGSSGGGVMRSMRSGFKTAVGAGKDKGKKKSSTVETVITVLLFIAVIALLFWRFGR